MRILLKSDGVQYPVGLLTPRRENPVFPPHTGARGWVREQVVPKQKIWEFVTIHHFSCELIILARIVRYWLIHMIMEEKLNEHEDLRRGNFKDDQPLFGNKFT